MRRETFRKIFYAVQTLLFLVVAIVMFRLATGHDRPGAGTYILVGAAVVMAVSGMLLFRERKTKD